MRFGRQVDDPVYLMLAEELLQEGGIGDISTDKTVIAAPLHIGQVLEVPGIGKLVQIQHLAPQGIFSPWFAPHASQ